MNCSTGSKPLPPASTVAALYRGAEQCPTVLCDEGDTYLGEDKRLVTFFNAGHRLTGGAARLG